MNDNFKKLIHLQHPNDIANNLQLELNTIVNTIAPSKIVQFKKDFIPYYDDNIRQQLNETHTLLQTAIQTYEFEHWVEYKYKEI